MLLTSWPTSLECRVAARRTPLASGRESYRIGHCVEPEGAVLLSNDQV